MDHNVTLWNPLEKKNHVYVLKSQKLLWLSLHLRFWPSYATNTNGEHQPCLPRPSADHSCESTRVGQETTSYSASHTSSKPGSGRVPFSPWRPGNPIPLSSTSWSQICGNPPQKWCFLGAKSAKWHFKGGSRLNPLDPLAIFSWTLAGSEVRSDKLALPATAGNITLTLRKPTQPYVTYLMVISQN